MRYACRKTKARTHTHTHTHTNTHTHTLRMYNTYCFSMTKWLHESASMLTCMYIAFLSDIHCLLLLISPLLDLS